MVNQTKRKMIRLGLVLDLLIIFEIAYNTIYNKL